jgi:hypothetical protein
MAVIGITYEELTPAKYESVDISYGDGMNEEKEFASGNFVKDWYYMRKFMIQNLSDTEHNFCYSSSVDHFIMDGAPFDSAILKFKADNTPYLDYAHDYLLGGDNGIEFFVEKNTQPTWEELKEICKS